MALTAPFPIMGAYLARILGLQPSVATAWCQIENGVNGNILGTTHEEGRPPHIVLDRYPTWQAGLDAAAERVKTSSYYAGIRTAIRSGNACAQRNAIVASPWSGASHYGKGAHFPPVAGCLPYPGGSSGGGAPHHAAEVTRVTSLYNTASRQWRYTLRPGQRLVVRGHAYPTARGGAYPVVGPDPWTNGPYEVLVSAVRLLD